MGANTYLTERERAILESARIGIAGAGGLGSNCAMHLVRAGVRRLVVADFDSVAEHNLNRQFYFRHQIGQKKVAALADNLRMIEPDLELSMHAVLLTAENADATFAGCQIVVEAFDEAAEKAMLLHALLPTGRQIVAASGLAGWGRSGEIRQRCVGNRLVLIGDESSDVAGGLAPESPRVGIVAAMQANAVVSILLGEKL